MTDKQDNTFLNNLKGYLDTSVIFRDFNKLSEESKNKYFEAIKLLNEIYEAEAKDK